MRCWWTAATISVIFVLPVWAADGSTDEKAALEIRDVVKQLQMRYEKTTDLQADFSQKTKIEGFERPVTSSGKVYIKKPGRLRWDYLDPATEQIYVNQDDVKVYVPEHKQVLVGKLTHMAASKAPLELLQGAAKLDESFEIQPTKGRERGAAGLPLLTLIPKGKEHESTQNLQKIVVEVFQHVRDNDHVYAVRNGFYPTLAEFSQRAICLSTFFHRGRTDIDPDQIR